MKAIQVMFDERLLRRLAESPEVRSEGRSAVIRHAVAEYLARKERETISRRYREAYSDTGELEEELGGWAEEGAWPPE
jgi:predicted transcriptional regulator